MTIQHIPEDLTATVGGAVTLAEFQRTLAKSGQWLPVDPPAALRLTIRSLLDTNASGPRRYGYGTVREHLLGLTASLPNGRRITVGGRVVKNVAGYDLSKLFVGARGELGTVEEATFKLRPLPEAEACVQQPCASLAAANDLIEAVLGAPITPVILDLVAPATVVVGFAGTREDVAWQIDEAHRLGLAAPASLEYVERFVQNGPGLPGSVGAVSNRDSGPESRLETAPTRDFVSTGNSTIRRISVAPSRLVETIGTIAPDDFIARAGNGILYCRGGAPWPAEPLPDKLLERVRAAFATTFG